MLALSLLCLCLCLCSASASALPALLRLFIAATGLADDAARGDSIKFSPLDGWTDADAARGVLLAISRGRRGSRGHLYVDLSQACQRVAACLNVLPPRRLIGPLPFPLPACRIINATMHPFPAALSLPLSRCCSNWQRNGCWLEGFLRVLPPPPPRLH